MTARKSKPWAVILNTAGDSSCTEYSSEARAYEKVRAELALAKAGTSRVTRIRVEKWDRMGGRWDLFDLIDPKEQP